MRFAYVWFTFFVLLMLANICYRFEIPSLRLFAIARASSEAALLAGILVRRALWQTDLLADPTTLAGFALAGIVLVLVCVVIWMSEKSVNGDWRVGPVAGRPAARAGTARALHEPLRRPGRAVRPDRP